MTIYASIFKPACTKPTALATYLNVVPYQFVSLNVQNCHSGRHFGLKINKGLTNLEKQASTSTTIPSHINNQHRYNSATAESALHFSEEKKKKKNLAMTKLLCGKLKAGLHYWTWLMGDSPRHISAQVNRPH